MKAIIAWDEKGEGKGNSPALPLPPIQLFFFNIKHF